MASLLVPFHHLRQSLIGLPSSYLKSSFGVDAALKGSALGVASYVQQKAKEATTTLKQSDWSKQQEALQRVISRAAECAPPPSQCPPLPSSPSACVRARACVVMLFHAICLLFESTVLRPARY